jgi:branched-chain amino acid transport system substrate-binding protein
MRSNRWFLISLLAVLALVVTACGGAATPAAPTQAPAPTTAPAEPTKAPEPTAAPAEPTKAAEPTAAPEPTAETAAATGEKLVIAELTDNSGVLAIYGPLFERGFEIGLDYVTDGTRTIAGRPIELILKDTASNPETGSTLAREAIEKDGAEILVGVPSSPTALAVGGIAAQNKKVYIAGPAAADAITGASFNPYVFRCGRQNIQDALTMGAALTQLGKNFIQISQDNAFGQGSAAGFYNVVKANGGTFPVNDTEKGFGAVFAPPDTTDFTPYINQILDSDADVLIVTWSGAGFVPMFQQMQQLGVFDQMAVATGFGDNQTLAKGYADAVNSVGVVVYSYSLFDTPENNYLTEEHKKRFNTPPDLWAEAGFNCAVMIKEALEATNGDTDGDKVVAALEGLKFKGPKGDYEVRATDHALLQPMTLVKLINTTDPDFEFFELVTRFEPAQTAPPCTVPAEQNRCK